MLRVTPIYGAHSHHPSSLSVALPGNCTLVEYGGIKLLVNVGLDGSNSVNSNDSINPVIPEDIDAVLLCDATLESLGGLPSYFSKLLLQQRKHLPTIYATYPVLQLGPMTLYDYHSNVSLDGKNPGYTLDDVDAIFTTTPPSRGDTTTLPNAIDITDHKPTTNTTTATISAPLTTTSTPTTNNKHAITFQTLKYSQCIPIKADGSLTLTAHRSGHVVGGAYWILQRVADETTVVIALTYNPAKELLLDASTLLQDGCGAPDALLTRPGGAGGKLLRLYSQPRKELRKNKGNNKYNSSNSNMPLLSIPPARILHANLIDQIMSVLRRDGHVLLPTDACGRVLELLLLLDTHWTKHRLSHTYKLVWVGPMTSNILTYVQAQLEWLSTNLGRQFDYSHRGHPFQLSSFDICTSVAQVKELEREGLPMVCVASGGSLDCGPARDLLLDWGHDAENAILFTDSQVCTLRGRGTTNTGFTNATSNSTSATNTTSISSNSQLRRSGSGFDPAASHGSTSTSAEMITDMPPSSTPSAANVIESSSSGTAPAAAGLLPSSNLSTAAQLLDKWCDAKLFGTEMDDEITVDVLIPARSPLEGKDLLEFNAREEQERRKRAAEEERIALLKEVELARGRLRLGEEDLIRESAPAAAATSTTSGGVDPASSSSTGRMDGVEDRNLLPSEDKGSVPRKKSRFDSNLFLKYSKPLFMTFIDQEEAVGIGQDPSIAKFGIGESIGYSDSILVDDYGIAIVPEKFHDLVTGSDRNYSRQAGGTGRVGDDALWMRRGGGRVGGNTVGGNIGVANKPQTLSMQHPSATDGTTIDLTLGGTVTDDEAIDEVALEIADLSEGRGIIRGRNGRPPTKVYTQPRQMDLLAEVSYIPLEGRVTSRAARQSVRALQPRSLVVLGGATPPALPRCPNPEGLQGEDEDDDVDNVAAITDDESNSRPRTREGLKYGNTWKGEAQSLAETVLDVTVSKQVFIPDNEETVELPIGHAAYSVRLIDTPYHIDGMDVDEKDEDFDEVVDKDENSMFGMDEVKVGQYTVRFVDCVATGQKVAADGSVVLAPRALSSGKTSKTNNSHEIADRPLILLSDGEVLLTDLRSTMIAQGLKAEYSTHSGYQQLLVNGRVVVIKDQASGKIHVEGPLCQDYFTVRSIVCAQYITL